MKWLSFILACYVFCLSVGPILVKAIVAETEEQCATICCLSTDNKEVIPVAASDNNPDGCCDDGACNPFGGCPGCPGFTIPSLTTIAKPSDALLLQPVAVNRAIPRLANHAIWHPPQIV
ncbi:MAG: hypothetical protein AAFZ63_20905 [Bacteroidota bacterium]